MLCPKCNKPIASFISWSLRPGPVRTCAHCGSRLKFVAFYPQLFFHAGFGIAVASLIVSKPEYAVLISIIALGVMIMTAFVLPWHFGRYKIVDNI